MMGVVGSTNNTADIFIRDYTGSGVAGLTSSTITAYYLKDTANDAVFMTLEGNNTYGQILYEVDPVNMPGVYRIRIPDDAVASCRSVTLRFIGNFVPNVLRIELVGTDYYANDFEAALDWLTASRGVIMDDLATADAATVLGKISRMLDPDEDTFTEASLVNTPSISAEDKTTLEDTADIIEKVGRLLDPLADTFTEEALANTPAMSEEDRTAMATSIASSVASAIIGDSELADEIALSVMNTNADTDTPVLTVMKRLNAMARGAVTVTEDEAGVVLTWKGVDGDDAFSVLVPPDGQGRETMP